MGDDTSDGLPPGHRIGSYRVERELGRGGFGITYLARDPDLDREVAIKEYFPRDWVSRLYNGDVVEDGGHREDFEWGLQRFREEAKILSSVRHANVVQVYAYLEQHGTGYIVMEYIQGKPLSKRLKQKITLPEADIRQFVLPIMDGLAEVHDKGVLHRDVTPANIMLAESRRGVLIDFGSARSKDRAESGEATILMTPSYAAPEQHRGDPLSFATDIYGLGAVLYRCVTGQRPWHWKRRGQNDRMPRLSEAGASEEYHPGLLRMIDAALAVRQEDRPQSFADCKTLLTGERKPPNARSATDRIERSVRELAEAGEADAQYRLGLLFLEGRNAVEGDPTRLDSVEAKYWFRMAAGQGHHRAQYRLHRMYEDGEGGDEDRSAAAEWETKAWQAETKTQCRLGVLCREEGADDEAEFWYRGAAYRGDVNAQYALGALYWDRWAEGKVVDAGVEVSLQWCVERAEEGSSWAGVFLADRIDVGIAGGGVEFRDAEAEMKRFARPDAAEPQESSEKVNWGADCATFCLAYKYLRMAARQGHPTARESCDRLGVFMLKRALDDRGWHRAFLTDLALETMSIRDRATRCRVVDGELLDRFRLVCRVAYETIKAGATIGQYESEAAGRLGCSKEDVRPFLRCCWASARSGSQRVTLREPRSPEVSSQGVLSPDFCGTPAINSALAEMGNADYQYERALLAHYESEWDEAESWYTRAAEQGHAKAQFDLGMMYFHGEIEGLEIGECVEHAVSYCVDAAKAGLDSAKAFLERDIQAGLESYSRGDYHEAELEFRRLAEQGEAQAQFRLAQMYIFATPETCADDGGAFDQARDWLDRAARRGYARAEYALYALLTGGYTYWLDVDPSDVGDGGGTATYWYWKAAQRAPSEQYAMGLRSEGDTEHADRDEAAFWYRFAGHQGHINAEFRLGLLAFCRLYGCLEDGWARRDVGWELLLDAACHGQTTAMALIWDGRVLGVEGEMETSAEHPAVPARPVSCRPPRNATFPGFADEMLAESDVCANEPRLLARLYDSYRRAATKAGVPWAKDFSSDVEIDSWYYAYELASRKHP